MVCRSALALPLGELSPKATERVFLAYPLRPSLRSDTSPKGGVKGARRTTDLRKPKASPRGVDSPYQGEMPRRGKGGRDSCRRRRLMRGRVLIFELLRVFEPNVAAAQNVQLFSSSGAPRHLPLKGKALVRRKPGGGIFTLCPKCARMAAVWGRLYDRASGGGCL